MPRLLPLTVLRKAGPPSPVSLKPYPILSVSAEPLQTPGPPSSKCFLASDLGLMASFRSASHILQGLECLSAIKPPTPQGQAPSLPRGLSRAGSLTPCDSHWQVVVWGPTPMVWLSCRGLSRALWGRPSCILPEPALDNEPLEREGSFSSLFSSGHLPSAHIVSVMEQEVLKHWVSPGRCSDQIYYLMFPKTQPIKDSLV